MSSFIHPITLPAPFVRSVAIAALMGATMLASPLTAARAESATHAPIQLAQTAAPKDHPEGGPTGTYEDAQGGVKDQAAMETAETKAETVDQRITSLHSALQITPAEESKWNRVAQSMRENAAAMQKLVAEKTTGMPHGMTAVEDLKTYEQLARAHVDGLKNLTASFETLYDSMPAAQKKVADGVFQDVGHGHAQSHS